MLGCSVLVWSIVSWKKVYQLIEYDQWCRVYTETYQQGMGSSWLKFKKSTTKKIPFFKSFIYSMCIDWCLLLLNEKYWHKHVNKGCWRNFSHRFCGRRSSEIFEMEKATTLIQTETKLTHHIKWSQGNIVANWSTDCIKSEI